MSESAFESPGAFLLGEAFLQMFGEKPRDGISRSGIVEIDLEISACRKGKNSRQHRFWSRDEAVGQELRERSGTKLSGLMGKGEESLGFGSAGKMTTREAVVESASPGSISRNDEALFLVIDGDPGTMEGVEALFEIFFESFQNIERSGNLSTQDKARVFVDEGL